MMSHEAGRPEAVPPGTAADAHEAAPDHGADRRGSTRAGGSKPRKNPAEKKALAYRKDHRVAAEYPQLYRRAWPRKKALRNQTYRRQVDRSIDRALATA